MVIKEQRISYERETNEILNEQTTFLHHDSVACRVETQKELGYSVLHQSPCCAIMHEIDEDFETIIIISKVKD